MNDARSEERREPFAAERRFGFVLAIGLSVAVAAAVLLGHTAGAAVLAVVLVVHLLFAVFCPRLLIPSRIVLEFLVRLIGNTIAVTVLGFFYLVILTPFSFIWRLLGKDALESREPRWCVVDERDNDPETLRKLF